MELHQQDIIMDSGDLFFYARFSVGRYSSVDIATRNGLGIESRLGRDVPHASGPALRPTQPHIHLVPGHSRG
jgi:hypothetical protein